MEDPSVDFKCICQAINHFQHHSNPHPILAMQSDHISTRILGKQADYPRKDIVHTNPTPPHQGSLKSASALSNALTTLTSILISRPAGILREERVTMRPLLLQGLLSLLHVGCAGS